MKRWSIVFAILATAFVGGTVWAFGGLSETDSAIESGAPEPSIEEIRAFLATSQGQRWQSGQATHWRSQLLAH